MTDLTTLGIAEAGRLMARGELTSTAPHRGLPRRIEAVDHKIASYITVTADRARIAATAGRHGDEPGACAAGRCTASRSR